MLDNLRSESLKLAFQYYKTCILFLTKQLFLKHALQEQSKSINFLPLETFFAQSFVEAFNEIYTFLR